MDFFNAHINLTVLPSVDITTTNLEDKIIQRVNHARVASIALGMTVAIFSFYVDRSYLTQSTSIMILHSQLNLFQSSWLLGFSQLCNRSCRLLTMEVGGE